MSRFSFILILCALLALGLGLHIVGHAAGRLCARRGWLGLVLIASATLALCYASGRLS